MSDSAIGLEILEPGQAADFSGAVKFVEARQFVIGEDGCPELTPGTTVSFFVDPTDGKMYFPRGGFQLQAQDDDPVTGIQGDLRHLLWQLLPRAPRP